ncbi:MAG TPA: methyltransferase domain-containing protein [Gemmatimonadaceae bacterium]|nr:methyltransferase domain-containing protein [Gemmatimonadaceae bacterium]
MKGKRAELLAYKLTDAGSYDKVVGDFDRFTAACTAPLIERLLAPLRIHHGTHVLDMGTGTGAVAFALYRTKRHATPASVTAIDLSWGMLSYARDRALDLHLTDRLSFCMLDAEQLAFRSASFDVVTSLFLLRHLPDPYRAVAEAFRVLRSGGVLAVGIGAGPPLTREAGRYLLARTREMRDRLLGKRLMGPQHLAKFLDERLGRKPAVPPDFEVEGHRLNGRDLVRTLQRAGFRELHRSWAFAETHWRNPDDFWQLQCTFSSPIRKRLQALSPDTVRDLYTEYLRLCRRTLERGGKLTYITAAYFVHARKP